MLGNNPDDNRLDVKKMQGKEGYRLRVGQWRVIFDKDDEVRIISIEKVGARGGLQMSIQIINSVKGEAEYVLLPIQAYKALKPQIDKLLDEDYESFSLEDYVSNPVALARIEANLTQKELSEAMGVSQAYVSKLEAQSKVSAKMLSKVKSALRSIAKPQ